jgi:hypothetical protein
MEYKISKILGKGRIHENLNYKGHSIFKKHPKTKISECDKLII